MKKCLFLATILGMFLFATAASAAFLDIAVTGAGDGNSGKDRYGSFSNWESSGFDSTNLMNPVYHTYEYGDGSWRNSYLQFGVSAFSGVIDDIISVSFNYNLLRTASLPVNNRAVAGNLYHAANSSSATGNASDGIGGNELVATVNVGDDVGWKAHDVTDMIKNDLTNGYGWSAFSFMNAGYAGLWFSAAESGAPAYLRIETESGEIVGPVPTPEPSTFLLLGAGLLGLIGIGRKKFQKA